LALHTADLDAVRTRVFFAYQVCCSDCSNETLAYNRTVDRTVESALKNFAAELDDEDEWYDTSYRADGRVLLGTHRFKKKLPINLDFGEFVNERQKDALEMYCADEEEDDGYLRSLKAIWTQTFYSVAGERLTSFSISPADCQQW
jgi:hypothetical protein